MKPIRKVLVANRGEIALRIMRTCRRMGIATVAVFSDADADAPFVRFADEAVRIGPPPATESYLRVEALLGAARATGADAIHPGYGFLSENPALPQACAEAGVVFIGPSAEVIRLLGSKRESKEVVGRAGVPVIPGYGGTDQRLETLTSEALKIGFPVLVKASAGGGGKGMRVVRDEKHLRDSIDAAKREAASSFGDDTLLIEKYLESPRHVEVQILGDSHGKVIHLLERECSIQRRHQKIIEESPSPALDAALRQRMGEAAVAVGKTVGYENAGTVEFIVAPDGSFYFLEVNTRLQVEHPVTEMVTGLDLVREQIRVAQGERLTIEQADVRHDGAAIECRLYAEDPDNGYLPTSGRIVDWYVPEADGLRVDSGVDAGQTVSIFYDPMLAKVVTHGATRAEAIRKMMWALERMSVQGLVTNQAFLLRVLAHPAFRAGELDTHFLERHAADVAAPALPPERLQAAATAAVLADFDRRRRTRTVLPSLEAGFRNNRVLDERVELRRGDDTVAVAYRNLGGDRLRVTVGDQVGEVLLVHAAGPELVYEDAAGLRRRFRVLRDGDRVFVHQAGTSLTFDEVPRFPEPGAAAVAGGCTAPMPGKVIKVLVEAGQAVTAGTTLLILEAMKMEHAVKAPEDGRVTQIAVSEGQQVDTDELLAVVSGDADE